MIRTLTPTPACLIPTGPPSNSGRRGSDAFLSFLNEGSHVRPTVLYEDNHLLVVDKPAGFVSQGALAGAPSLVEWGKSYVKRKYNKPGNVYLGVVSRLDAQATGVLVFARTSKAAARLNEQFRERAVRKTYWVLVAPALTRERGRMEDWLRHDEGRRRVESCDANARGAQRATLGYRTLSSEEATFPHQCLEVHLETGRKHQIRVQCALRGSPVVGDTKYGSSLRMPRGIALHSRRLQLVHPVGGRPLEFQAPPPNDWTGRSGRNGDRSAL